MQRLVPDLSLLSQEYVLVQAWKKTANHIRRHNWFADTLELDRTAVDLPKFIERLGRRIRSGIYETSDIRIVPAPKSQPWMISANGRWRPVDRREMKIRPLAQVSLADQVVATAILLCLSERVETRQGNPTADIREAEQRAGVISYGNRLFCDFELDGQTLVHRWGSTKLYRAYFQDYRAFLTRSEIAALEEPTDSRTFVLQTDLKQFYDRVSPTLLHQKLSDLMIEGDDVRFREFIQKFFTWQWSRSSKPIAEAYATSVELPDYSRVALPQGLVSAGFFSNVVLMDFDDRLRAKFGQEIVPGIRLKDACRYVDDLRLTVTASSIAGHEELRSQLVDWLGGLLAAEAPGLFLEMSKTKVAEFGGTEPQLVRQSRKMGRIQAAISGGFDAAGGEEVIQAIEALVRSQISLNSSSDVSRSNKLTAVPDVKDETVGRFAAVRFRTTYRSLRPLLEDKRFPELNEVGEESFRRQRLTQDELDEEARSFSLTLIDRWIEDPSNVRLLRIALDLWPSPLILKEVLNLLEPFIRRRAEQSLSRDVALYSLADVLHAGATETGFVEDQESFPKGIDIEGYRFLLLAVAIKIDRAPSTALPWFLKQQARLFLAVHGPQQARLPVARKGEGRHRRMLRFLVGQHDHFTDSEYAILAIVARRSFLSREGAVQLVVSSISERRFAEISARDLEFARDIYRTRAVPVAVSGIAEDLGLAEGPTAPNMQALKEIVASNPLHALRNEIGVLSFALEFIREVRRDHVPPIVTPSSIYVRLVQDGTYKAVSKLAFRAIPVQRTYRSIYTPPEWASREQNWRFKLGYLLRYLLTARIDFTVPVRPVSWKEEGPIYRPALGHWYQRLYGIYNGHEAFGDDWLPISQFTQDFLFSLLIWPGCRASNAIDTVQIESIEARVAHELELAKGMVGRSTGILMLPISAPIPGHRAVPRPLRGCVVQAVTPDVAELKRFGPDMSDPAMRRKHRNHLSTVLAAVEKMLDLRDTHKNQNKRLDWLILPELSVHPRDVQTHLVPFARAFKTAILAGLTYEPIVPNGLFVNSALWILPRMVPGQGLQTIIRRQGKQFLSPMEAIFNQVKPTIQGFRPCQWLIGYEWSSQLATEPLWLTGAICYDGTDLDLASDLRSRSDVFAIPALNKDVGTFDQMAQALHYHMYQLVIVANNGTFGGSNAHLPKGEAYERQIFHTHGQPQASISFFEIDNIADMKDRKRHGLGQSAKWKYPPAGY